jgi:hypothetical protein
VNQQQLFEVFSDFVLENLARILTKFQRMRDKKLVLGGAGWPKNKQNAECPTLKSNLKIQAPCFKNETNPENISKETVCTYAYMYGLIVVDVNKLCQHNWNT